MGELDSEPFLEAMKKKYKEEEAMKKNVGRKIQVRANGKVCI